MRISYSTQTRYVTVLKWSYQILRLSSRSDIQMVREKSSILAGGIKLPFIYSYRVQVSATELFLSGRNWAICGTDAGSRLAVGAVFALDGRAQICGRERSQRISGLKFPFPATRKSAFGFRESVVRRSFGFFFMFVHRFVTFEGCHSWPFLAW